jgi:hypothetical protein
MLPQMDAQAALAVIRWVTHPEWAAALFADADYAGFKGASSLQCATTTKAVLFRTALL